MSRFPAIKRPEVVTFRDILKRAAVLIRVGARTRGRYARDKDGNTTSIRSPCAVGFCAVGALQRARHELTGEYPMGSLQYERAYSELLNIVPRTMAPSIPSWSDSPKTTKTQIADAMEKAAGSFKRKRAR